MSFKLLKDELLLSVYSKLINVLRTATDYFRTLAVRKAEINKIESGENRHVSAGGNNPVESNAKSETGASDFSGAPEHWLMLLRKNHLTLLSFEKKSHKKRVHSVKRLHSVKSGTGNAADNIYKKTKPAMSGEKKNQLKMKQSIFNYNQITNSAQSEAGLTTDKINVGNVNPFKFNFLSLKNKKDSREVEAKPSTADSGLQVNQVNKVKQGINLQPVLSDNISKHNSRINIQKNIQKRTSYKNMTGHSSTDISENPYQNKAAIHSQTNIKGQTNTQSQTNTEITNRTRGAAQQTVLITDIEKRGKEKSGNNYAPLSSLRVTSKAFNSNIEDSNIEDTNNSLLSQAGFTAAVQEKRRYQQDRINPDFISSDDNANHFNSNNYFFGNENPVSNWPDLPEDVWNEKSSENEFIIPLNTVDTVDIRGILWNG